VTGLLGKVWERIRFSCARNGAVSIWYSQHQRWSGVQGWYRPSASLYTGSPYTQNVKGSCNSALHVVSTIMCHICQIPTQRCCKSGTINKASFWNRHHWSPKAAGKLTRILQDEERFQLHFRRPVLSSNESLQDMLERPVSIRCACARDVFWITSFTCWTFVKQTTSTCDMTVRCTIQDQQQQTPFSSLHTVFWKLMLD